ncbi:hypothetical protein Tco_0651053 [Tanacetum coccineum]
MERKNMPKEYSFAWRGSVDVERDHMWDICELDEKLGEVCEDLDFKSRRAYVGMLGDNKYKKAHCVMECEFSCRRIRLGKF